MEQQAVEYGWQRVQTPGFEDTALFARTAGEASDVVNKEMYTFTDRSDRSLTLRPRPPVRPAATACDTAG